MSDLDRPRLALYVALSLVVCFLGARYLRAQGVLPGAGAGEVPVGAVAGGGAGAPDGDPAVGTGTDSGAGPAAGGGAGDGADPVAGGEAASVRVDRAAGGLVAVHVAGEVRRPGLYRLRAGARVDDALRRAGGPGRRADLTAVNLATRLEDGRQVLVPRRGAAGAPAAGAPQGGGSAGGAGAAPAPPVNLNTATLEQLDTLDGVGPGIAQRILAYREEHGGFKTVDELAQVPGIGPKRLATLKPLVSV